MIEKETKNKLLLLLLDNTNDSAQLNRDYDELVDLIYAFMKKEILQTPSVKCPECRGEQTVQEIMERKSKPTCPSCTDGLISIEQVMEQNERMREVIDKIVSVLGHLSSPHKTEITIIQDSTLHDLLKQALKVGK